MMKAVGRKGFTLVEVCLVMLIFGVAVSSLMALFPVSLRQGSLAVSDSVVSAFGDSVLNSLAGAASGMDDWSVWDSSDFGRTLVRKAKIDSSGTTLSLGKGTVRDYLGLKADGSNRGGIDIRYKLDIEVVVKKINGKDVEPYGKRLYRVILRATDNPSTDLDNATVFVTYLAYLGEVP